MNRNVAAGRAGGGPFDWRPCAVERGQAEPVAATVLASHRSSLGLPDHAGTRPPVLDTRQIVPRPNPAGCASVRQVIGRHASWRITACRPGNVKLGLLAATSEMPAGQAALHHVVWTGGVAEGALRAEIAALAWAAGVHGQARGVGSPGVLTGTGFRVI